MCMHMEHLPIRASMKSLPVADCACIAQPTVATAQPQLPQLSITRLLTYVLWGVQGASEGKGEAALDNARKLLKEPGLLQKKVAAPLGALPILSIIDGCSAHMRLC